MNYSTGEKFARAVLFEFWSAMQGICENAIYLQLDKDKDFEQWLDNIIELAIQYKKDRSNLNDIIDKVLKK